MKKQLKLVMTIALVMAGNMLAAQADAVWPADEDWTALKVGSGLYNDISSEINPAAVDLVGTANSYSAGYWALVENGDITGGVTNDAFMFRRTFDTVCFAHTGDNKCMPLNTAFKICCRFQGFFEVLFFDCF